MAWSSLAPLMIPFNSALSMSKVETVNLRRSSASFFPADLADKKLGRIKTAKAGSSTKRWHEWQQLVKS